MAQELASQPTEAGDGHEPALMKDSWVQCDRCEKWRRIPAAVAESLEEETPWCAARDGLRAPFVTLDHMPCNSRHPNGGFRTAFATPRPCRYCEHNTGRFNSCAKPQELSDAEIDESNTPAVSGSMGSFVPGWCSNS